MHDLLIRGGSVVDGTGAPARNADIAIAAGRIAEVGKVSGGAKQVIDADGCVVSPGFIDPHTHYDAQICWDGAVTPSSWHGVTSVVMGNCGVGIAPCKPETREIAMRDLVNVEAIPFEVLNEGITWEDRKSTRLNSSHSQISYAVFCLKKKKKKQQYRIQ